jgi:hypothetical protein
MSEVETNTNGWAATYVAKLPVFFVNVNKVEGTFLTLVVLWNVKRPYLHQGGQREGKFSQKRPLAFREIPKVIQNFKKESLFRINSKTKIRID